MQKNKLLLLLTVFTILTALSISISAQITPDKIDLKNYDVTIRIIFGSNTADKNSALPKELSPAVEQIKKTFDYSSFNLKGTYKVRLASGGGADYKNIGEIFPGNDENPSLPDFLEWSISGLNDRAGDSIYFQRFHFGARIPLKTGTAGSYQYESVGLDLNKFGIEPNQWVQIGTITSPNADGTAFVMLFIKPI